MERKAVTMISGVLFLAITLTATVIAYYAATPIVERIRDAAFVEQTTQGFLQLDEIIREVAAGGKGTKRTFTLRTDAGTFVVKDTKDTVSWLFETKSPLISPRTKQAVGNLIIGSNLDVSVSKGNYSTSSAWILENEHLIVYINQTGGPSNYTTIGTNDVVLALYQKEFQTWLNNTDMIEFEIDGNTTSKSGNGYTVVETEGENLPYGRVTFFLNNSYQKYFVNFTLEAGADFLTIEPFV